MVPAAVRAPVPSGVAEAVAESLGCTAGGRRWPPLGRGFSHTARVDVESPANASGMPRRSYFVKWSAEAASPVFEVEALGLRTLARVVGAPVVSVVAASSDPPFLVLDWIEPGGEGASTQRRLGRELARLHRLSSQRGGEPGAAELDGLDGREWPPGRFGFPVDNWLGATVQRNTWSEDWVEFFRHRRLGFQLELLRRRGRADSEFERAVECLLERLDQRIAEPVEPPCALHGDLWAGNYRVDPDGRAWLIDPATYLGRREADLSMTTLFGGFASDFYAGYEEVWPLAPGWRERLELYSLYHLMNHWNLFGEGYRSACLRVARRYA